MCNAYDAVGCHSFTENKTVLLPLTSTYVCNSSSAKNMGKWKEDYGRPKRPLVVGGCHPGAHKLCQMVIAGKKVNTYM